MPDNPYIEEQSLSGEQSATDADASAFLGSETTLESHTMWFTHSFDQLDDSGFLPKLRDTLRQKLASKEADEVADFDAAMRRVVPPEPDDEP